MSQPQQKSQPVVSRRRRWRLVMGIAAAIVLLGLASAWFAPQVAVWRARQRAERDLAEGAVGAAQATLAGALSLRKSDWRVSLAQATCHRLASEKAAWQAAVDRAAASGASPAALALARELGALHFGEAPQASRGTIDALLAAGADRRQAVSAVVHALLAAGSEEAREEALAAIDAWQPPPGDVSAGTEAERAYLRGLCLAADGDRAAAQEALRSAIERQPRHELAKAALARSLEEQYRLAEALPLCREVLAAAPTRLAARLDLARVLRKLNRSADAGAILKPLAEGGEIPPEVCLEAGEIAYESGDYAEALSWFERADLDGPHVAEALRSAASNFALAGNLARSAELFARIDDAQARARQSSEFARRLRIDPGDASAAAELAHLSAAPPQQSVTSSDTKSTLSPLFAQHCAACHGQDGDGTGPASRYLYPRPRDLRFERYRLVSSPNQVPTAEDIALVVRQGVPGTSMPAFGKLTQAEQKRLIQDVILLYQARLKGDPPQEPDGPLSVPELGQATAESNARGQSLFARAGCQQCHGVDGSGAGAPPLFDDSGRQTVPRDLAREPMKGGASLASLYLRIRLGMPGTPHPAAASLTEQEIVDLVHFCRSLASQSPQPTTNYERSLRMSGGN